MKIHWVSEPNVSESARLANALVIEKLGLPKHKGAGRLAVVGGGTSIRDHIRELRNWDGEVWAINGTINWCLDNGINAWFYTADAMPPELWIYDLSRVKRAVMAPDCAPEMFEHFLSIGAEVTLTCPIQSGPTSANASDYVSLDAGYTSVTYFGCEGSFEEPDIHAQSHAFDTYKISDWMIVELGGEYFKTKAEFISQAIMLSNTIAAFPHIYSEKSGGLLRAMIEHGQDYDVYMISNTLMEKLKPMEAA